MVSRSPYEVSGTARRPCRIRACSRTARTGPTAIHPGPDRRPHGDRHRSAGTGRQRRPARSRHILRHRVDCVTAVLDDVGADRAAFWGYSLGAMTGYAVAAHAPERLTRWSLLAPTIPSTAFARGRPGDSSSACCRHRCLRDREAGASLIRIRPP